MNKFKKLFAVGFTILSLTVLFPQTTNAQYVDVINAAKEWGLDGLAYYAANMALKRMAAQSVNWINSGFKGNPAYITDPAGFFLDIGDNAASKFLSGPKVNQLCAPFKAQVRLALVKNYVSEGDENFSCSLSILKNNYDQFMGNFSQGGWGGWFELTQNQGNNPYGAYIQAQNSLTAQLGIENNKYITQLQQGKGFLSFEKCKPSSVLSQSDINSLGAAGTKYKVGDCWNNDVETVTPGTVIENQLNKVIDSGQDRLKMADEFDEVITALLNQLMSRVIGGFGSGLSGASKSSPGAPSVSSQLATEPPQQSTNPNAGQGTQLPSCSSTPSSTNCVTDEFGNTTCDSTQGSTACNMTPVVVPSPTGGQCTPAPDGDTKHGNHTAEVSAAKSQLASQGMTWVQTDPNFECNRYEITKLAVQLIGGGAMLLSKSGGTNCQGYSTDTITFPDGYTYDVLNGTAPDGAGPMWSSSTCLTQQTATSCSGGYRSPLTPTDDATLSTYVKASWEGWNGVGVPQPASDLAYWVDKSNKYEEFSDTVCRIGWNAYWEARMQPGNTGSADPKLGDQLPRFLP